MNRLLMNFQQIIQIKISQVEGTFGKKLEYDDFVCLLGSL